MKHYIKSKNIRNIVLILAVCLLAILIILNIPRSNDKEVKALVRTYDLTTEENSSNTLIVKNTTALKKHLKALEVEPEQIIEYGNYKIVKFNSQEEMEESLTKLEEQQVEVEVDTLLDVTTDTSLPTATPDPALITVEAEPKAISEEENTEEIAVANTATETTPSTPVNQYLQNNPSTKQVKVAIIDTGIDKENELFQDRIIDTKLNYSTTGEENDITDDNGHGTVIAEIIAKKTENNVKLMPIKVANENGKSTVLSVYMAINEAISQKADIINISMNTFNSQSGLLREAIDKADAQGIKVVVSSGNLGIDVENIAPSNIESAIVVGAVHSNLEYEGFSNYGDTVDYCSYGVYDSNYGTSISAAHISAVIAALESSGVAPAEIESTMDQYIQDLGETGKDKYYGKGFISLYNAEECFTTTADEDLEATANKRKEMLQKLLKADWKSMTDDEFNTLISEIDYDIVGYFLKTLSEEDFNTLTSRDTNLANPVTVGTAFVINDVSEIESVNWPDLPDKEYAHLYEYCVSLCDESMNTSVAMKWTGESQANFFINFMDYGIGKGDTRYKITIGNLTSPDNMISTFTQGQYSQVADSDDEMDDYLQSKASGYACADYVITNDNGGPNYSLGANTKRMGTAFVLSEKYADDSNAARWQGIYIRGLQYKIPAHSIIKESGTSDIGQGRLCIGYISINNKIIGNKLETKAYANNKQWDTIDVECNSYNCGLAPDIYNAYHNSTLLLSVNPCKEAVFIDPGNGAVQFKKGNGYTKKYSLTNDTYKNNVEKDGRDTYKGGIQYTNYKVTDDTATIGLGEKTSNVKVIAPSGYIFIGWKVKKQTTNSKGTLSGNFDKSEAYKWAFSSLGLKEKVVLEAVYEIVMPSPTPSPIPTTDSAGLNVHYQMYKNGSYTTFNSTHSDITINTTSTVVGNSKLASDTIYPSTYYNDSAIAVPAGYKYGYATYKDVSYKIVTKYSFTANSSADPQFYGNKTLKAMKNKSKTEISGVTATGFVNAAYLTDSEETGTVYKRTEDVNGTYIRVPTWHNKENDTIYSRYVHIPITDVQPVDNQYVYKVAEYSGSYVPDYNRVKYDLDRTVEKKDTTYLNTGNDGVPQKDFKVYNIERNLSKNNGFVIRNEKNWNLYLKYIPELYDIVIDANGGYWDHGTTQVTRLSRGTGFADCVFRYNIPRQILNNKYSQYGDENARAIDKLEGVDRGRDIYQLPPTKTGYTLNWDVDTWEHDGKGDLSISNNIITYTPKDDLSTVTIKLDWIPNTYKLRLHVRKPDLTTTHRTKAEDEIIVGVATPTPTATPTATPTTDETTDTLISIKATSDPNYIESTFTYEDSANVCAGDGTDRVYVEDWAVPYCKGFELVGFSLSEDNQEITNTVTATTLNGMKYWVFDGSIAGDVDLYPVWKEKPLTYTIDTDGVPLIDKNTDSINGNVTIKDNDTTDELDVWISGNKLIQEFWFNDTDGNSFGVQATDESTRINTILGNLTKYGYELGSDGGTTTACAQDEWRMLNMGKLAYAKYISGSQAGEHTVSYTNKYTYTDANGITVNDIYDGDVTVVANWVPHKNTLTIDGNGGTFMLSDGTSVQKQVRDLLYREKVQFGLSTKAYEMENTTNATEALKKPVSQPTRYGYVFTGWKIILNDTGASDDKGGRGAISIVDKYNNTILVNKDTGAAADDDEDVNNKYLQFFVDETALSPSTEYFYTYTSEPNYNAGNDGYNWDGDVIIQAQWKANEHTLTVDNNGGRYKLNNDAGTETAIWSKTFEVGTPIDFATTSENQYLTTVQNGIQSKPVRYGHTLRYWEVTPLLDAKDLDKTIEIQEIDTKTNGKEKYAIETPTKLLQINPGVYGNYTLKDYMSRLDGDVTIKAHWLENLYNLTVDPNGGEFYRPSNQNGIEEAWTSDKYTRNFVFGKETIFSTKNKTKSYISYKEDKTNPEDIYIYGAVTEPMRRGYTFTGWSEPLNNSGQHVTTGDLGATIQNKVIDTNAESIELGYWQYTADYAGDVTISAIWNHGQKTDSGDPYGNAYSIKYGKGLTDCSDDKIPTPNPQYTNYDKDVTLYNKGELTGRSYEITLNNGFDYDKDGVYKAGIGIYIKEDNENRDVSTRSTYKIDSSTISGNLEFNGWDVQKEVEGWTGKYGLNSENGIEYKVYDFTTVHYQAGQTVTKANFTSVPDGQVTATARYDSKTITLSNPTLQGYTFQGWYTQPNGGGTKVTSITIDEATTKYKIKLYAYWKPNTYIIRYNGNGHWNTTQAVYTQTLTFDKPETLTACKFTRNPANPGYTYNGDKLAEGYSFVGWEKGTKGKDTTPLVQTAIGTGKSITYTDKASGIFNMTDKQGEIIDLYAIWKKSLSVAFDLNGGLYDGKTTIDKLETTVWNSTYQHTFDITQYYGTVGNNGINTKVQKVDNKGNTYRFLGWSLNKNATVPDNDFIVYDSNRTNKYTIWDDKTLYAVWEKLLVVDYTLDRTLSNLEPTSESIMPQLKNITAITSNPIASVVIKPGEQGSYKLSIHGTPVYVDTLFTEKATNIYSLNELAKWKDDLNPPNEAEAFSEKDKTTCGLNKKWITPNVSSNIMRKFYVPVYYSVVYPSDTLLTFTHTIQQESYYYKYWVSGKDKEEITITSVVFIKDEIPSTLDELKALIKTNVVQ